MNTTEKIRMADYLGDLERTHAVLVLRAAEAGRNGSAADALVREREAAQVMRTINRVKLLLYMPEATANPEPHPSSALGGMRHAEPSTPTTR